MNSSIKSIDLRKITKLTIDKNMAEISTANVGYPISLEKSVKVMVARPKISRSQKEKKEEEEVLVIEGIEVRGDVFVKFDVLINDEDEAGSGADNTEFAGSFVNVPWSSKRDEKGEIKMKKTQLRLGINELLEDLGAEDDEHVLVSLVPRCCESGAVTVGGIKIELEA